MQHTGSMDALQDLAHDMGAVLRWGRGTATQKHWVRLMLPDRKVEVIGDTYDQAAALVLAETCEQTP